VNRAVLRNEGAEVAMDMYIDVCICMYAYALRCVPRVARHAYIYSHIYIYIYVGAVLRRRGAEG